MDNLVFIRNYKQACAYVKYGVKPINIEYINERLTFIFNMDDTKEVWKKWLNRELEI